MRHGRGRGSPPLAHLLTLTSPKYFVEAWQLFDLYLTYVVRNTPHPYMNIVSYHLHNACEASSNSIEKLLRSVCVPRWKVFAT